MIIILEFLHINFMQFYLKYENFFQENAFESVSAKGWQFWSAGIILCMRPTNERRCYNVTSSLIGRAHTRNDPCDQASVYWMGDYNQTFLQQNMELLVYGNNNEVNLKQNVITWNITCRKWGTAQIGYMWHALETKSDISYRHKW